MEIDMKSMVEGEVCRILSSPPENDKNDKMTK
jgi:hypothetical protein